MLLAPQKSMNSVNCPARCRSLVIRLPNRVHRASWRLRDGYVRLGACRSAVESRSLFRRAGLACAAPRQRSQAPRIELHREAKVSLSFLVSFLLLYAHYLHAMNSASWELGVI